MDLSFIFAFLGTFILWIMLFLVVWNVLKIVAYRPVFKKMGVPLWMGYIPFLNTVKEFETVWDRRAAAAYYFLSCASIFLAFLSTLVDVGSAGQMVIISLSFALAFVFLICVIRERMKLAKAFGKGFFFMLGLLFFEPVFLMILGFGNAEYKKKPKIV